MSGLSAFPSGVTSERLRRVAAALPSPLFALLINVAVDGLFALDAFAIWSSARIEMDNVATKDTQQIAITFDLPAGSRFTEHSYCQMACYYTDLRGGVFPSLLIAHYRHKPRSVNLPTFLPPPIHLSGNRAEGRTMTLALPDVIL